MRKLNAISIDGAWTSPSGRGRFELTNPATEAPSGWVAVCDETDVDHAVRAARRTFDNGWAHAPKAARLSLLAALIEALELRRAALADAISDEIGAPIDFARSRQVDAGLDHLQETLRAAEQIDDDQAHPTDGPAHRVRFEPVGVAALITPWNWPLNQVALKLGAAIVAGCPVVLKPSELSSRTAVLVAEAMQDAERASQAPPGVFNLILGDGSTGAALVAHPDIDVVSFTGSTDVGRQIAVSAAQSFKRVTLELGGKSPNLLFEDCDLETAISQGLAHCFRNAGQSCNAASRMLVAREIYDDAVALAAQLADTFKVGPPEQPGDHLGPQVSHTQFERVQGLIETGVTEGARLVSGGPGRPDGITTGFYSRPTVFADVASKMRIFREEIFGPVLTMTPFETEEDGIALANDTDYGLAAYLQTGDPARADRVSRKLNAGMIQVNGSSRAPGAPFGGVKASGVGREAGIWGIRAFQDIKSISGAAAHDL
ncbi:MAG: aldehyde dehydrogenase family protein [Pseudomonadota bacterium]